MQLERELKTYERELPNLQGDNGKFVLIHEDDVVGVFGTYEDALKEGYEKFQLQPFLVRQIQAVQQVQFISRLHDPQCHILL